MEIIRKISAFVLAVMMIALAGLAYASSAADMDGEEGKIGEFTDAADVEVQANSVIIYKEIVAVNPDSSDVFAPAISYSYAIAPAAGGDSITDSQGVVAVTKPGPTGATITSSVAWTTSDTLHTSADGEGNRKPITVDFSGVTWEGAGVYRYVITETPPAAYAASGVTEGDTSSHTRYLDVYVKDNDTSDYEIYGYVCFAVNDDITSASEGSAQKTEGFVDTTDNEADKYYTYDLEVTKTVENDRAMEDHDFPFTVTFTPATTLTATNIKLDTETSDATLGTGYAGALSTDSPKVKHGGSVKYIGIPYLTAVAVHETVDVAGTTYQVTTTEADTNVDEQITGTAAGVASSDAEFEAQEIAELESKTADFTNTMLLISPTGIVMRVAPYLLMLAAGVALLVIFMVKRRKHVEEDD